MNFVIVGAGALGTILAAHLVRAGNTVTLLARGYRAQQLNNDGLCVTGLTELRERCVVCTDPSVVPDADALILSVKTYDNAPAIRSLGDATFNTVCSVANGVMKNDELAQRYGTTKLAGAMADTSGELTDSGLVRFTRNVCLHVGALDPNHRVSVDKLAEVINASGVNCAAVNNIETVEWSKFVGWTSLLVLSLVTRLGTAKFLADEHCATIAVQMIREMATIAAAKGVDIIDQSPLPVASISTESEAQAQATLRQLGRAWRESAPDHRMSSLQDLERGKRLEVNETLGYAIGEAGRLGIDTPVLKTCYELVAAINAAQAGTQAAIAS